MWPSQSNFSDGMKPKSLKWNTQGNLPPFPLKTWQRFTSTQILLQFSQMLPLVFCGDVSQWHVIHHSHQEALPLQSWRASVGRACFSVLGSALHSKNVLWSFRRDTRVHASMCGNTFCITTHLHSGSISKCVPHTTRQNHPANTQGHRVCASWDIY